MQPSIEAGRNANPGAGRIRKLPAALLIAGAGLCALLVPGLRFSNDSALLPAAAWTTPAAGWQMPMPERVRAAGIAADDIRYLQNGRDVDIFFRNLTIEKHPAVREIRLVALTVHIEPSAGPQKPPQPMEGILSARKPVLLRTNISLRAEGAVGCLQTGTCDFWLELSLQEPGGKTYIERSRRVRMPARPTV